MWMCSRDGAAKTWVTHGRTRVGSELAVVPKLACCKHDFTLIYVVHCRCFDKNMYQVLLLGRRMQCMITKNRAVNLAFVGL